MKLKDGFITHKLGSENIMLAVGEAAESFHGVATSNETAAFIIELLKQERSYTDIVDAMLAEYNADRETITSGVDKVLAQLREIGALEE